MVKWWRPDTEEDIPYDDSNTIDKPLARYIKNKRKKSKTVLDVIGYSYDKTFEKNKRLSILQNVDEMGMLNISKRNSNLNIIITI